MSMLEVHLRIAEGSREARRAFEKKLPQQIQEAQNCLTLRNFLRVLLSHHVIAEEAGKDQAAQKLAAYQERIDALQDVLEKLAKHKRPVLSAVLIGTFDLAFIREAKAEFEAAIVTANEIFTKRGVEANIVANWNELATELVNRAPNEKKIQVLQRIMTELAQDKDPILPAILEGFDLATIRKAWTAFENLKS